MKLIILSAGYGTRFLPLTKTVPKALIPILGTPLIDHVLSPFVGKVNEIIFVINEDLGIKIRKYIGNKYEKIPVKYVVQKDELPKGTFSALKVIENLIKKDEIFCVCNCDDLLLKKDVEKIINSGQIGIGVSYTQMPWKYLSIRQKNGLMSGFQRHQAQDDLVTDYFSNGFYILSSKIFSFKPIQTNNGEIGLPHTLFENLKTYPLKILNFSKWQSVNGPEDIKKAEDFIKRFIQQ